MTYYAHINSHNILTDVDMTMIVRDEFGSDNVKNIEVSEEVYINQEMYIYKKGKVVINPNYEAEKLAELKREKSAENDQKASEARYGKEFILTVQEQECVFDTTQTTQTDLLTAFAVCSTGETYNGWVTNNGVELDLTLADVTLISQTFKAESDVYHQWNEYKTAIDEAETIEEVENITIIY